MGNYGRGTTLTRKINTFCILIFNVKCPYISGLSGITFWPQQTGLLRPILTQSDLQSVEKVLKYFLIRSGNVLVFDPVGSKKC